MEAMTWLRQQWDRTSAVGAVLLALLAIYLGWHGVSHHKLPAEQIPYLASGAVIGMFLVGVGGTLWLSADLRDEWRKLDDIDVSIRAEVAILERLAASQRPVTTEADGAEPRPSPSARGRLQRAASDS